MTTITELTQKYNELNTKADELYSAVDYRTRLRRDIEKSISSLEAECEEERLYLEKFKKAKKVIQRITDKRNKGAKEYIKDLVNKGLTSILQRHAYDLEIDDDTRGDSQKITDIQLISTATNKPRKVGTAVRQMTSLVFIISLIEIAGSSKILGLDEYLSGASGTTASKLSDILVSLANNNEFQFFVVNHVLEISNNPEFERIYLQFEGEEKGLCLDKNKTEKEKNKRLKLVEQS